MTVGAARPSVLALVRALALAALFTPFMVQRRAAAGGAVWWFEEVSVQAGLVASQASRSVQLSEPHKVAGGAAAGDFDGDGLIDLYLIGGDAGPNALFRNRGDGTFEDVATRAGVALEGQAGSGPLFFDHDGDGRLDLFVGAVDGGTPRLFRNMGDGTFADVTGEVGLSFGDTNVSATAGDYDGDGWLDLFVSHWGARAGACHLWHNDAGRAFSCADETAGLTDGGLVRGLTDRTFTANLVDLDEDGKSDLVVTADYGQSTVWRNEGGGRLRNVTNAVISDQNGMGSAVGDYDGDGHLDWFVSSIFDGDGTTEGNWGASGNRLYRNVGKGLFEDTTNEAGVREGDWGWGASFADFDNDGRPDLIHVNGWPQGSPQFRGTAARLFMSVDGRRFREEALARRFDERVGGRGVVCFDYDGDGDLDVLVANNNGPYHLWRNDGGRAAGHFLSVAVTGDAPNSFAVGAKVFVSTGGREQRQDVRAGSNYVSQNPLALHFGLGSNARVDTLRVVWPDGRQAVLHDIAGDRVVHVTPSSADGASATDGASHDGGFPDGVSPRVSGGGCAAF